MDLYLFKILFQEETDAAASLGEIAAIADPMAFDLGQNEPTRDDYRSNR